MPSRPVFAGLGRRVRALRRRLICFDRELAFLSRPHWIASTHEGSPLFAASAPWRFRFRQGWPAGMILRVRLEVPGEAGLCTVRLGAGAGARSASVPPDPWAAVWFEAPSQPPEDGVYELSIEPGHPAEVRIGELRLTPDARSPVLRNLDLVRYETAERRIRLEASPSELTIESTSVCNLRCVMCPHGVGQVDRPKHLPASLLEKLAPALARAQEIQLHVLGEPLLSPSFWRALELTAGQEDSNIGFNTNLTELGAERIEKLLASGLSYLNVSLDAATEETFRKIRGHAFEAVLGNVRALVRERDARGLERPALYVNMTLMRENIREAPDFVSLARQLGAERAYLWHLNEGEDWTVERDGFVFDYAAQHLSHAPALSNRMIRLAVERAEKEGIELCLDQNKVVYFPEPAARPAAPAAEAPAPAVTPRDCTYPWRWLHVQSDGAARACCFMTEPVGNVAEGSVEELWNGEAMQAVRRSLARDELHPFCRDAACKYAAAGRS